MKLEEFIATNTEAILASWQGYARTLQPATNGMTKLALRNHAHEILDAVVADMRNEQARHQQFKRSVGEGPRVSLKRTAAETHAVLREKTVLTSTNSLPNTGRCARAC